MFFGFTDEWPPGTADDPGPGWHCTHRDDHFREERGRRRRPWRLGMGFVLAVMFWWSSMYVAVTVASQRSGRIDIAVHAAAHHLRAVLLQSYTPESGTSHGPESCAGARHLWRRQQERGQRHADVVVIARVCQRQQDREEGGHEGIRRL